MKTRKSLNYSIADGAFYSAMVGFGESFFSAFGVYLKASVTQLGLLEALPKTLGAVSQLWSGRFLALIGSRKKLVTLAVLIDALFYIPIALTYFLGNLRAWYLIAFVCAYWTIGNVVNPAWTSWMGDLTKDINRGSYFGRRNKIAGTVSLATLFMAGYILQEYGGDRQYIGFIIVFMLAFVSRLLSFAYLMKQHDPDFVPPKREPFSIFEFIWRAKATNFGKFTLFSASMSLSVFFLAPFFAVFLLDEAGFDYRTFALILGVGLLAKIVSMPVWGKAADRWGAKKALLLAGLLLPAVPILFFFSSNIYIIVIAQIMSGFAWAGFELASLNFMFESTTPEKRVTCVAYYNVLNGMAILAGAIIASFLVQRNGYILSAFPSSLHVLFKTKYHLVFLLSFILRYIVCFIFLPALKDTKKVEQITYSDLLFQMVTKLPAIDTLYSITFYPRSGIRKVIKSSVRITKKGLRSLEKIGK